MKPQPPIPSAATRSPLLPQLLAQLAYGLTGVQKIRAIASKEIRAEILAGLRIVR